MKWINLYFIDGKRLECTVSDEDAGTFEAMTRTGMKWILINTLEGRQWVNTAMLRSFDINECEDCE